MPTTPNWQAATLGSAANAGHINQFLGTHVATILYAATQTAAQSTAGASATTNSNLYLSQSFATAVGQTTVGYVLIPLTTATTSGASLAPVTLSLYANSAGAPTGSPLFSVTVTAEYANKASGGTNTVSVLYPLNATGLTASTTYWLVITPSTTNSYSWYRSNQVTGASTSANGTTWAAQSYGFLYKVFDKTTSGLQLATVEDSGARWTATTYNATNQFNTFAEYTAGQTTAGYLQSFRTFAYNNGMLNGVS